MKRRQAADKLAAKLFAAERAVDQAMAEIGDLAGELPRARLEAGVWLGVGQGAFEQVAEAVVGMARVRASILAAHRSLEEAKQQVGLGHVTMTGGIYKPEMPPAALREVA